MTTTRVTVPVEPTEAMLDAWHKAVEAGIFSQTPHPDYMREAYRAMLSAAPAPEGGAVDVREIALAAMTEMRRSGESYEMCARWISERVNRALATREEAPAKAGEASFWFDPRDPEVTDTNPDNILIGHYAAFDVTMIQCGDMAMFGFWFEPADGSEFQYRYFNDRDQADAEALAQEAALRAQPQAREARRTMTLNLSDAEMTALEELIAKKDLDGPKIFRDSFKLYQAVEHGAASVTWTESGPLGLPATYPPQAREDAQPVARVVSCVASGMGEMKSVEWCGDVPAAGSSLYIHPAPDALRVAKVRTGARVSPRMLDLSLDGLGIRKSASSSPLEIAVAALRRINDPSKTTTAISARVTATEALAALQAEQGAK